MLQVYLWHGFYNLENCEDVRSDDGPNFFFDLTPSLRFYYADFI